MEIHKIQELDARLENAAIQTIDITRAAWEKARQKTSFSMAAECYAEEMLWGLHLAIRAHGSEDEI